MIAGLLKPHPKKCKCNVCMDEEITSPETKNVSKEEIRSSSYKAVIFFYKLLDYVDHHVC